MQQGFVFFHAACSHQRHLMIAVECLQRHLEDERSGCSAESDRLREELVYQIVELSEAMTADMEMFTWALLRSTDCLKANQQFLEIEGACLDLLAANQCVAQTGLAVARTYDHAPGLAHALADILVRTKWIHAQLCDFAEHLPGNCKARC